MADKPTNHLEGLVLEAKVLEGKVSKKEFRKVKIGSLWLSCFESGLYPLLVKGKYLAVDYTTTQGDKYTNYTIQVATEMLSPHPAAPEPEAPARGPKRPLEAPGGEDTKERRRSIEAQVAAYCTAQVLASRPTATATYDNIGPMIRAFFRGMQEAKAQHTGGAASNMGQSPPFKPEPPAPETTEAPPVGPGAAPPIPEFANPGAFMNWVRLKHPQAGVKSVCKALGVEVLAELTDLQGSARDLLELWGKKA